MEYRDVAILAAKEAGEIHKHFFRKDLSVTTKTSSFDRVTEADIEAEKKIVAVIRDNFSDHNFLCEEHTYTKTSSGYTWIIDPLDGTNNFSSGMPIFCASVALMYENRIIAGAIYDATRDELFFAEKGKGAFLNGSSITVNQATDLETSLLITGFYYDRGDEMIETLDKIKLFFQKRILGLRRMGAAALDLCYVASGRAAGFWEFELSPWDFAAGKLIIEEAGGTVTDREGNQIPLTEKSYVVASNGHIHPFMLETLKTP